MKKILLLIISVFLLSGCEAVYNVKIDEKTISDELVINALNKKYGEITNKAMIDYNYENFNLAVDADTPGYPELFSRLDGYNYYNKEKIDNSDAYGLRFTYTFDMDKYEKTYLLLPFNYRSVTNSKDRFSFSSGNPEGNSLFKSYPDLDKLTVNVTSYYQVIESNADAVNDQTYTWVFTKNNYENKTINIVVDKTSKYSKLRDSKLSNSIINIVFMVLGATLLFGVIIVLGKVKNSNN